MDGLQLHGAYFDALAAADAGGIFNVSVFIFGEAQQTGDTLDQAAALVKGCKAHHRPAQNDTVDGTLEAAQVIDNVLDGSAETDQNVCGFDCGTANGQNTFDQRTTFVASSVNRVCGVSGHNVAANAGGNAAGFHFAVGVCLNLHLFSALRILNQFGYDYDAVLFGVQGVEQIDSVLLVFFDAVVSGINTLCDTNQLNTLEQFYGVFQHGAMVTVQVRFAFSTVDNQGVDLAAAALNLEVGGEHSATHTYNACFTDSLNDSFRILQLLFGQRSKVGAGGVQTIVFDYDGGDQVTNYAVASGLDSHDLTGNGSVDRSAERCGVITDLLAHGDHVANLYQRLAGCTDVHLKRNDNLRRLRNSGNSQVGLLHFVRMDAAVILKWH